jgi:hypothetical protein
LKINKKTLPNLYIIWKPGLPLKRVQMKTNIESNDELRNKIKKGLDLTFKKLLKSKRQTDGYLVFSEKGKIIKVKARDIPE